MKTKHLLIGGGVAIAALALYGYKKVVDLTATFDAMTIKPSSIRNPKLKWSSLTFDLDIRINNPTSQDFAVNGLVATLKSIVINYKGKFLGTAVVNIDEIMIPKFSSLVIRDLPILIENSVLLKNIWTITGLSVNDFTITGVVEVLGSEYTISNE